jgi:hypothetical protein
MVAAGRWARGLHSFRIPAEQRVHLAALLTLFVCASAQAADPDITFARGIAQSEFRTFSHLISQGIYASPIGPARASGLLGFDIGVAATVVKVDTSAPYWRNSVGNDSNAFVTNGYVGVPRIVFSKGFGSGTISGSYAKITDSGIKTYGGALDLPIIRGTLASPELAVRATYAQISGLDVYHLKTYGVEGFVSKGFGPLTPYAAVGRMRSDARGTIPAGSGLPEITLTDKSDFNRSTVGLRISLLVPKITIEATQAEVRSYSAKISFGF